VKTDDASEVLTGALLNDTQSKREKNSVPDNYINFSAEIR
jgi:hypothetical protein